MIRFSILAFAILFLFDTLIFNFAFQNLSFIDSSFFESIYPYWKVFFAAVAMVYVGVASFYQKLKFSSFLIPWSFILWRMSYYFPLFLLPEGNLEWVGLFEIVLVLGHFLKLKSSLVKRGENAFCDEHLPIFSLKRLTVLGTLHFLLMIILIGMSIAGQVNHFIVTETKGFIRLSPKGVYFKEKKYQKEDKIVRLISMIHLGEEAYYKELSEYLSSKRAFILLEGVTDKKGMLKALPSVDGIAHFLGLESQREMVVSGKHLSLEDLLKSQLSKKNLNEAHIIHADMDISQFSPKTIEILNQIGFFLQNSGGFKEAFPKYITWMSQNVNMEEKQLFEDDILHKRNIHLLKVIKVSFSYTNEVIVPWGAMHLPDIEKNLLKQGFIEKGEKERRSLSFF